MVAQATLQNWVGTYSAIIQDVKVFKILIHLIPT